MDGAVGAVEGEGAEVAREGGDGEGGAGRGAESKGAEEGHGWKGGGFGGKWVGECCEKLMVERSKFADEAA